MKSREVGVGEIVYQYWKSPFGEMILGELDNHLVVADWRYRRMRKSLDQKLSKALNAEFVTVESNALLEETKRQIETYSRGKIESFDLPVKMVGTEFQMKVWTELMKIPFGSKTSYKNLAINIGDENAVRAVASANGANTLAIIVPCHRVVGSDGSLTGYAGGLTVKRKLLRLESRQGELFEC